MYLVMKSVRSSSSTPVVLEWVELTLWTLGLLEIPDGVFRPGKNPPLSLGELPNELDWMVLVSELCLFRGGIEGACERGRGGVEVAIL